MYVEFFIFYPILMQIFLWLDWTKSFRL